MGFEKLNDTADVGIIQADFSSGELVAVGYASAVPGKHWFYGTSTAGPNGTSWSGTTPPDWLDPQGGSATAPASYRYARISLPHSNKPGRRNHHTRNGMERSLAGCLA
jgi:hypothetical protein